MTSMVPTVREVAAADAATRQETATEMRKHMQYVDDHLSIALADPAVSEKRQSQAEAVSTRLGGVQEN